MVAARTKLFLCAIAVAIVCGANAAVKGVHPDVADKYNEGAKSFQCLDGSKTIPFSQVNDDLCDCGDGSDEPGTSACNNGKFFCRNAGFTPKVLYSSAVNDGICDCCDGTDEDGSRIECANNCDEMGAELRKDTEERIARIRRGLELKQELVSKGSEAMTERETRKAALQGELELQKAALKILEDKKNEAEEAEKAEKDRLKAELAAERAATADTAAEEKPQASGSRLDTDGELVGLYREREGLQSALRRVEQLIRDRRADVRKQMLEDAKRAKEEAAKEEAAKEEEEQATDGSSDEEVQQMLDEEAEAYDMAGDEFDGEFDEEYHDDVEEANDGTDKAEAEPEVEYVSEEAEELRKSYSSASSKTTEMEQELADIDKKLQMDLGENKEFAELLDGDCVKQTNQQYTYELCPLRSVKQGHTRLGNFEGWEEVAGNRYAVMKYTGGEKCWNGPQRSTRVNLVCSDESTISDIDEPSMCAYEMTFHTPAACTLEELDRLAHSLESGNFHEDL